MAAVWLVVGILFWQVIAISSSQIEVSTTKGKIRGFEEQVGNKKLNIYYGIPYAKPPTENLRFKRPEEISSWQGVRNADTLPPDCIQLNESFATATLFNPKTTMSEDCLYLNIWAPAEASTKPRAVMVWIYGGGFSAGSSTSDWYNGRKLASSKDVILVTLNYRLGALGFFYNGKDDAPGNMGLLDQQLALRWVKDNIAEFGGDAERITIFGESAGSASVSYHLLAEGSHDLFRNAILQSGSCLSYWAYRSPPIAKQMSKTFAKAMGCMDEDDMECLLKLSAFSISRSGMVGRTLLPTLDGYFLKEEPKALLESGKVKKTSTIIGFNKNEGSLFAMMSFPNIVNFNQNEVFLTDEQFQMMVEKSLLDFTGRKDSILTEAAKFQYRTLDWPNNYSYIEMYDKITGDSLINCGVIDFANQYAASGGDVYMYLLEHKLANSPYPAWMGAPHGLDIFYIFGSVVFNLTADEEQLMDKMRTYWANLAKTGKPTANSLRDWPLYDAEKGSYLPFNIGTTATGTGLRARECAFWNSYMPKLVSEIEKCTSESAGNALSQHLFSVFGLLFLLVSLLTVA